MESSENNVIIKNARQYVRGQNETTKNDRLLNSFNKNDLKVLYLQCWLRP